MSTEASPATDTGELTGGRRAVLRAMAVVVALAGAMLVGAYVYYQSENMLLGLIPLAGGVAIFARPSWDVNRRAGWLQIVGLVVAFIALTALFGSIHGHNHDEADHRLVHGHRHQPAGQVVDLLGIAFLVTFFAGPATLITGRVLFVLEGGRGVAGKDVPAAVLRKSAS